MLDFIANMAFPRFTCPVHDHSLPVVAVEAQLVEMCRQLDDGGLGFVNRQVEDLLVAAEDPVQLAGFRAPPVQDGIVAAHPDEATIVVAAFAEQFAAVAQGIEVVAQHQPVVAPWEHRRDVAPDLAVEVGKHGLAERGTRNREGFVEPGAAELG